MANILADFGMAVPGIVGMQHQEAVTKAIEQSIAIQNFQMQEMQREQERLDAPIPIEHLQTRFADNPTMLKTVNDLLTSGNGIKTVGGKQFTSQRDLDMVSRTIKGNHELYSAVAQSSYDVALQKNLGLQNQLKEAQASQDPKKIEKAQLALKQSEQQLQQMIQVLHGPELAVGGMQAFTKAAMGAMAKQMFPTPHAPVAMENTQGETTWVTPGQSIPQGFRTPASARQEGKPDKYTQPLPMTDKGWTVSTEQTPQGPVNMASKLVDGKLVKEPLDPQKHGKAEATSAAPLQRREEESILTEAEANTIATNLKNNIALPENIALMGGGFGAVGNANRGMIAKAMLRVAPDFNWKNATILQKYVENPNVFMGLVNINAVRPRVEALRDKFQGIKNWDFMPANEAKNALARMFGNQAIADFDSTRTQVVFELQRALTGIGMMSDSRVLQELKNLDRAYSPGQMNKSIDAINEILDTRFSALLGGPIPGKQAIPQSSEATTYQYTATGRGGKKIGSNDGTTWYDIKTGQEFK